MADDKEKEYKDAYASKLEAILEIGQELGYRPYIGASPEQPGEKREYFVTYEMAHIQPLTAERVSVMDPKIVEKLKTDLAAALGDDKAILGSNPKHTMLLFSVSEMEKRNADGKLFERLKAAKPKLDKAVKDAYEAHMEPYRKREAETKARHEGYAKRMSALLGTEVKLVYTGPFKDVPELELGDADIAKSLDMVERLRPVRNKVGISEKDFYIGVAAGAGGKIRLLPQKIDEYDAEHKPGAFFAAMEKHEKQFKAAVKNEKFVEEAPAPSLAKPKDFAEAGVMMEQALGISGMGKVTVTEKEVEITLSKDAFAKLPPLERHAAKERFIKLLREELPKTATTYQGFSTTQNNATGLKVGVGKDSTADDVLADVQRFATAHSKVPLVGRVLDEMRETRLSNYVMPLHKAFGAASTTRSGHRMVLQFNTKEEAEAKLPKIRETLQKHFGFKDGKEIALLEPGAEAGPHKAILIDLAAVEAYEAKEGAVPFVTKLAELTTATDTPPGAEEPAPPAPPRTMMDMVSENAGLGIGGIIGGLLGWMLGGPIGALLGALLSGFIGAKIDGSKGVLGLNGFGESSPLTPNLAKEVSEYAKVRFTNYSTGVLDTTKAQAFVKRYESMVKGHMSPQEQDKRAEEIKLKTADIKDKLTLAAAEADHRRSMTEALAAMQDVDKTLIAFTDGKPLPAAPGLPLTGEGLKKAVSSSFNGRE